MKKQSKTGMAQPIHPRTLPAAMALACLVLAGCGGGGGNLDSAGTEAGTSAGTSAGTGSGSAVLPAATSLSGKVIDGYIEGAVVCLDLNTNQVCDAGEPKATTVAGGKYTLITTGVTEAQMKAAHLFTTVPDTAKDADDNGQTLKEAKKSAFNLLAPAASYVAVNGVVPEAVISPLTTLVSHDMIAKGTVLDTAQKTVRTRLGLAETTDLKQDFVAKKEPALIAKAQMLTVALGEVKALALADTVNKASDKQALFMALEYLQGQVAELQKAFDAAKKANASASNVALVKEAFKTEAAKPVVADLLGQAQKTTESSAVSSVTALLEQGFYSANHALEACSLLSSDASGYCTPSYSRIKGAAGKVSTDIEYRLNGATWAIDPENGKNDWTLSSDGWKQQDICPTGKSHAISVGADGVTTIQFCSGLTERVTAREVDASGKTLVGLGLKPPSDFQSLTMPAGSKLYWFDFANFEDKVELYTGSPPQQFVTINGSGGNAPYSSLAEFISVNQTPTDGVSSRFTGWSSLSFSFDAGGTKSGGNLTLWDFVNGKPAKTGTATYEIKTVLKNEVLIINAKAPDNKPGFLVMFAVKDGKVYGGSFRSVAVQGSSEPSFNKTMINAILAAGKKPAVLE